MAKAWVVVCSLSMNKALSLIPSTPFSPEMCVCDVNRHVACAAFYVTER